MKFLKKWLRLELIVIVVIGLAALGGQYMNAYYEDKEEMETFLDEYYNQVLLTSSSASYVLSNTDDPEQLEKGIDELAKRIDKLDTLLSTGHTYVDDHISVKGFAESVELQEVENSTPSESQLNNIENLKKAMDHIAGELRSDDPARDNKTVSVETFNDILSEGIDYLL
ncbi:hypothetical protein IMZ31_05405 [Pontibacillus sp. ALD_SL1]|uniref:hypothetical protein n=1 Tax=Pontibacillus sp. ALD_SL1 TaxID=2777185 RepID=UPI001A967C06|nr:hypothetical protein [Pontibacillus sp. ALD_SL1]QST01008.1 hypothetical protein IMZ31_05405 [Pontibacillus sp. ALD_SL1]